MDVDHDCAEKDNDSRQFQTTYSMQHAKEPYDSRIEPRSLLYLLVRIIETKPQAFSQPRLVLALSGRAHVAAHTTNNQDGKQKILDKNAEAKQVAGLLAF